MNPPTSFKAVPGQDELEAVRRDLAFHPSATTGVAAGVGAMAISTVARSVSSSSSRRRPSSCSISPRTRLISLNTSSSFWGSASGF